MKHCNLCGFPVISIHPGPFGSRCLACQSTFIHRAIGHVIDQLDLSDSTRVYELSSRGALFRYLKRKFRNVTFSEFFDDVPPGTARNGVQCQDVQALTYPDASFDLVTSTEVFEHVPDDTRGFSEIFRVLRRGAHFVFTVPLADTGPTVERARLEEGKIVHLLPPVYHEDRIRGKKNVLTFRDYGWDIHGKLEYAGFSVDIVTVHVRQHAIPEKKVIVCRK